jgi:hypothetical protein
VLLAPSVAEAAPTGSVAGWRSPVVGGMTLTVWAIPDGVALKTAVVTLGGVEVARGPFTNGNCEAGCPAEALLDVNTKNVDDGPRELVVTVIDANDQTHRLGLTQSPVILQVANDVVHDFRSTVTVSIGSGTTTTNPSPPGGPVGGDEGPSCRSPRLSMRLADRPLRFRRGVPVLKRGRVYRYEGRLTCRINGARRAAPRGFEVQVRNRLRGAWTISKPSIEVRKAGEIVARLAYRSSRVIIFRVRGATGDVARVRIPIRVVRR